MNTNIGILIASLKTFSFMLENQLNMKKIDHINMTLINNSLSKCALPFMYVSVLVSNFLHKLHVCFFMPGIEHFELLKY